MSRGLFMRALAWVLVVGLSAPAWAAGPLEVDHPLVAKERAAYDAKDYEGALAAFEEAKKEWPEDPAVEYNRGVALAQLGRVAEAKQAFQRVAEANRPELQEKAWYNLGNVHATPGERKEALQTQVERAAGMRGRIRDQARSSETAPPRGPSARSQSS